MFVIRLGAADRFDPGVTLTAWRAEAQVRGLAETAMLAAPGARAATFAAPGAPSMTAARGQRDADGRLRLFDGRLRYRPALQAALGLDATPRDDLALFAAADRRWQTEAARHLHGDYAALSWDPATATLRASVDHACGLRLYHASTADGGLVLASHLPLLLATPGVDRRLDGLALGVIPLALINPGDTAFHAVELMPSGCTLTFCPGRRPQLSRWWQPPGPHPHTPRRSSPDIAEQLAGLFDAAVDEHLDRDAPMATMLSGGLDSSLVAGFAARRLLADGRPLHAYTAVPHPGLASPPRPGWDASDWQPASLLASRYPNIRHVAVHAGTPCLIDSFRLWHQSGASPVRNSANCQWIGAMAADAHEHGCRSLLGGGKGNSTISVDAGADALNGRLAVGDLGQVWQALRRADASLPRQLARMARAMLRPLTSPRRRSAAALIGHLPIERAGIADALLEARRQRALEATGDHHPARVRAIRIGTVLAPDYRALHGIELRDPTADRHVAEAVLQLPAAASLHDGHHRALARLLGAGVVPDEIRWRTRRGQQSPEQDGYFALHAERYREAWQIASASQLRDWFDVRAVGLVFDRLLAGSAAPGQGAFMHRILDIGLFLDHAARRWGVDADLSLGRASRATEPQHA